MKTRQYSGVGAKVNGSMVWNALNYERQPTQARVARTGAITCELADVVRDVDASLAKELTGLNASLSAKQLPPVKMITRAECEKE